MRPIYVWPVRAVTAIKEPKLSYTMRQLGRGHLYFIRADNSGLITLFGKRMA